jgi:hypothetical protein
MSLTKGTYSNERTIRIVFYCLWLALAFAQAGSTNLIPDEAYYWEYSRQLAWGYFDHPPVIAVMIKWGYALLQNEAGVRMFSILAIAATIYTMELITRPKNILNYYLAVSSLGVLHIAGMLAVPDVPLMLFTATFFLLYRNYLTKDTTYIAVLLSLNIALLLLSKYHGILVIVFTILSNLQLLKRRSFWMIVLLSGLLFLPHVMWQLQHDLPSIKFHLQGRNTHGYQFNLTTDYMASIPVVFAPVTGLVLLYNALRTTASTSFERTLKLNLRGILLFFLVMSFRGRIEANWLFYTIIPAVCLGYPALAEKPWAARFIRISFIVSIVLILGTRVLLIDGVWKKRTEFSGWKPWADSIKKQAAGRPVAFMNSYQRAAEYAFYSGELSFSLTNVMGRKDQYGIWNLEDSLQGEDIMFVSNFYVDTLRSFPAGKDTLQYSMIDNFRSSSNITIRTEQKKIEVSDADSFSIDFTLGIREGCNVDAEANVAYPMYISYEFFNEEGFVSHTLTTIRVTNTMLRSGERYHIGIAAPPKAGKYNLLLSISTGWMPPSITGGKVLVTGR